MRKQINKIKPSIAFAFALLTCTIAYGHGIIWYEDILPDLYTINRVLASEPAKIEEQSPQGIKYTYSDKKEQEEPKLSEPEVDKTSEEYIKSKIEEVFGDKADEAKLICGCESRYNHKTWGDTTTEFKSVGLFQIRELPKRMEFYGLTTEKLEDVDTNIEMAKIIYDKAGSWQPWTNCGLKYNLLK